MTTVARGAIVSYLNDCKEKEKLAEEIAKKKADEKEKNRRPIGLGIDFAARKAATIPAAPIFTPKQVSEIESETNAAALDANIERFAQYIHKAADPNDKKRRLTAISESIVASAPNDEEAEAVIARLIERVNAKEVRSLIPHGLDVKL